MILSHVRHSNFQDGELKMSLGGVSNSEVKIQN
jgi:hypothetical protein